MRCAIVAKHTCFRDCNNMTLHGIIKSFGQYFIFRSSCGTILLRHSLIILPAGILLVKMYAWSSYPAGSELCRNRTGLRFSVRSFGCALFYYILIEIRIFRKRAILMALIKCPDCGKDVSNRAPICIYCGCPLDKDNNDTVSGFYIVSHDGNTVSLQCQKCKRTSDYLKNVILTSESEQEWITNTTIRCSCCGNTMGKGLKIKQERKIFALQ